MPGRPFWNIPGRSRTQPQSRMDGGWGEVSEETCSEFVTDSGAREARRAFPLRCVRRARLRASSTRRLRRSTSRSAASSSTASLDSLAGLGVMVELLLFGVVFLALVVAALGGQILVVEKSRKADVIVVVGGEGHLRIQRGLQL